MTRKEALQELLVKVKAGGGDWITVMEDSLDAVMFDTFIDAYHGSLDAALSLLEAVLPGLPVQITDATQDYLGSVGWAAKVNWPHMEYKPTFTATGPFAHVGYADTPSRALLIAILEALVEMEGN